MSINIFKKGEITTMSKNRMVILLVMVFIFTMGTVSSALAKVGYINLQRLVNESKMGQDARKDIESLRKKKKRIFRKNWTI